MILIIDNYDSFTYNLYQLVGIYKNDIKVIRNDDLLVDQIYELQPESIIISPGPGHPQKKRDFGVGQDVIRKLGPHIPILGICLGHQGIYNTFGGNIKVSEPVHGKKSTIKHYQSELFDKVENPLKAIRYHSLTCDENKIPNCLNITARTSEGLIMGIEHKKHPIYGLQFHPESVGTRSGSQIIANFLEMEI
jgi:anthranilate synthase component 2